MLLIHGFTGAPPEMRLVADYLNQRGVTISAPLLPGHGTTVQDMNRCRWTDWTDHVQQALSDLQKRCQTAFVGGLSMGSLLALFLAADRPEKNTNPPAPRGRQASASASRNRDYFGYRR